MQNPKALGLDQYEIYNSKSSGTSLSFSGGEIKAREFEVDNGHGIRALKKNKLGFGFCENESQLSRTIKHAASISKFSPKSGFSFPGAARIPTVNVFDKKVADMEPGELKGILDQIRDTAEKYSPLSRILVSSEREHTTIENTNGFLGSYERSELSIYSEVMDGNGSGFSVHASNFAIKNPDELGLMAAEMAKSMRHPKKPKSGNWDVIISLETLSSLLDILLPSFSGDWERRKVSKLCGKRGKRLFDESFSLFDDGLHPGLASRPFDDEGIPSKKRPLIQNGLVKKFTYDLETAALAMKKSGGHCNRTHYSMPPVGGVSNLVISSGKYSNLEDELKNYILVHSAHGSHTANVTTGDFGLEVSIAFQKKGNEMIPVRGFMLVGNVFELFNNIAGIEKKQETYGSLISPRIAFRGLRIV